ncbi:MAG: SGNH/GDSL hydrolase family protein [Siphonobacter sp.]
MKYCLLFCLICTIGYAGPIPAYQVRKGLPNFFSKIKSGQSLKVAYLGGSITEAGDGWREQSLAWLKGQYPKASFTQLPAAVGGTGSDLGVFRLQKQILDYKPDLVFVEFAVNDNGKQADQIYRSMEGIVRKIWKHNPKTDICFVYTLTGDMAPIIQDGKLPVSTSAMEEIANYYGIPSIQLGLKVAALAKEGKLIFKGKKEDYPDQLVFSADNVHPYPETGHKLYAEALQTAFLAFQTNQKSQKHRLGKPFIADNWENAQLFPVAQLLQKGTWQELSSDAVARQLQNRFSELFKSTQSGAYLEVRIKGTICGMYDVIGPGCGQYAVQIDGGAEKLYSRFDSYATYYRANYFMLPALSDQEHTIRFTVSDQKPDKIAILKTRNNAMDDPKRFEENACYAGYLLVVGKVIK